MMRDTVSIGGKAVLLDASAAAAPPPSLALGKVTRNPVAEMLEIEIGDELFAARIGFGCIVRPIAGDRVLAARSAEGVFVLTVLERLVPDRATLALSSGGAIAIEAQDVNIVSRNEVSVETRSFGVRSAKFSVIADSLTLFGRMANWVAEHMRISAKTQEIVADTLSAKAMDRIAIVERTDVLRAGSVSQTIDNVAVTSAPAVVIATTEDLRLDGKRVTVG